MQALSLSNACEFGVYLNSAQVFTLDLANATLLEIVDEYIKFKSIQNPNSYKRFSSLIYRLKRIEEAFNCVLTPSQITDIFYNHFIAYQLDSNLALSTIESNCSQLSSILKWSTRYNCKVSPSYDEFKVSDYKTPKIALTQDEVSHIYHFDLSAINRRPQLIKTLEKVRDHFVLSCNLGQRYSDMIRINADCFDKNLFRIMQQKTGNKCKVDIDKYALDKKTVYKILQKYNFKAPYTATIYNYDKHLKELFMLIGGEFKELVRYEVKVNGLVIEKYKEKYKLLASHTARRTFITVNTLRGFTPTDIRMASGHKTIMSLEGYQCLED